MACETAASGSLRVFWDSQGPAFHPITAKTAVTPNTATRNGMNPDFRAARSVVAVPARGLRAGGRLTAGLCAAASTTVGSLKLPPRAMVFQPRLAAQAFSRAWVNSWQVA